MVEHFFPCVWFLIVVGKVSTNTANESETTHSLVTQLKSQELSEHNHFQNEPKLWFLVFILTCTLDQKLAQAHSQTSLDFSRRITLYMWFKSHVLFYNLMSLTSLNWDYFEATILNLDEWSRFPMLSTLQLHFIEKGST